MMDDVTPEVRRRMRNTHGRDTKPELEVRHILFARGRRYRVNHRPVPSIRRTGDIVFTRAQVVVCIDGCFWHQCPEHFATPHTRTNWWMAKINGNVARDAETTRLWEQEGWTVLRFWEHEDPTSVADLIEMALANRMN